MKRETFNYIKQDIKEDEDSLRKLKFNLKQTYFRDIQEYCGIYLLIFSNGMHYVGKSNNLAARIKEHFKACVGTKATDWHKEVHSYLVEQATKTNNTIAMEWFENTEIYIQYTKNNWFAASLEEKALNEIYQNKQTDKYYNTEYFIKEGMNFYKRKLIKREPKKIDFSQYLF